MEKVNIKTDPGRCVQCSSCQLRCSLVYAHQFNPSLARIVIEPGQIRFRDSCVEKCHLCADFCVYGALTLVKG